MIEAEHLPTPAGALFQAARNALVQIDRLSYGLIAAAMALMVLLVAAQVFCRYVLATSIDSADELARLFFVWAMFLAIPHGVRHGSHVGIEAAVNLLPITHKESLFRLNSALAALLMALIFAVTLPVILGKWTEMMPTLEVTAAVYYIAVLLSAGHCCLHLLLLAWGGPRTWQGNRP